MRRRSLSLLPIGCGARPAQLVAPEAHRAHDATAIEDGKRIAHRRRRIWTHAVENSRPHGIEGDDPDHIAGARDAVLAAHDDRDVAAAAGQAAAYVEHGVV